MLARNFFLPLVILTFFFIFVAGAFAQNIEQIAYNVKLTDPSTKEGMLVKYADSKYDLTVKDYDPQLYGVVVENPAVVFNKQDSETKTVVTAGQAQVLVSKKGGNIQAGDLITSSKDKGIAQKATKSGHVLGKALEKFPSDTQKGETGLIKVLVNVTFNEVSAKSESLTNAGLDQVSKKVANALVSGNIPNLLKYVFALLLGIISFFIGLSHFVRSNRSAVDAIARNPLAKADIQRQLIVGTAGILFICGVGLALAVWILFFL